MRRSAKRTQNGAQSRVRTECEQSAIRDSVQGEKFTPRPERSANKNARRRARKARRYAHFMRARARGCALPDGRTAKFVPNVPTKSGRIASGEKARGKPGEAESRAHRRPAPTTALPQARRGFHIAQRKQAQERRTAAEASQSARVAFWRVPRKFRRPQRSTPQRGAVRLLSASRTAQHWTVLPIRTAQRLRRSGFTER